MNLLRLLSSSLLTGCAFGLQPLEGELPGVETDADTDADSDTDADADTDTDSDSDTDPEIEPRIDSIEPSWGTTAGGAEVTIIGEFLDDASVRFGGTEAEVISVAPKRGELVVRSPAQGSEGSVAVKLESGGGSTTQTDGFMYYQDGTGKTGAIGVVQWLDQVGTYWDGAPTDVGYSWFWVNEPTAFDWGKVYASSLDSCQSETEATYSPSIAVYDAGAGASATLSSGAKSITMPWSTTDGEFSRDLTTANFGANSDYELSSLTINSGEIPEFTMPNMVSTPAAFNVTAPALSGSQVPMISQSFSLAWSGGSTADGVFVLLSLVNGSGSAYQETVTCHLRDDGSFNVPSGAFNNGWPTNRQLDVIVIRYVKATGTLPFNNSESAVLGQYAVYGAGFTR